MTDIGRAIVHAPLLSVVVSGSGHPACAATARDGKAVGNTKWSPDGEWIACSGNRHGASGIFLMRPGGRTGR
jgi:Tol biopolymer transport system component